MDTTIRYCQQCKIGNDTIICKGCNQFLIEDPLEIDSWLQDPPLPQGELKCATAWAHWGDTIACMSYAKRALDLIGQDSCDFVYTGPDPKIARLLSAQPWVNRVFLGNINKDYMKAYALACNEYSGPGSWLPIIKPANDPEFPKSEDIWLTNPSHSLGHMHRCYPLTSLILPQDSVLWANKTWDEFIQPAYESEKRVIMLHPLSTWSESAPNHWPHWDKAIDWLLNETDNIYVLTGLETNISTDHPNLINMVGRTPSTIEMLALAALCDGVISTCNCVSLWTIASNKPAIICGNRVMDNYSYFFRRYVDRPPNVFINVDGSLADFQTVAMGWLSNPNKYAQILVDDAARRVAERDQMVHSGSVGMYHEQYIVVRGLVAGVTRDFGVGSVVDAKELNGDPAVLEGQGLIEPYRRGLKLVNKQL